MKKPSDFTKKKITSLWEAYKAHGGTQVSLGLAAGVAQAQISDWVRGRVPTVDGLVALARGFGVPISEFFPPETQLLRAAEASPIEGTLAAFAELFLDSVAGDQAKFEYLADTLKGLTGGRLVLELPHQHKKAR